jgi:hypothetical protein
MKKLFVGISILAVTALSACTGLTNQSLSFETNEDIISFQALAAANLMPEANQTMSTLEDVTTEPSTPVVVDQVTPYVELVEQLLGSNNGLTVTTLASDNPLYETMMTFETTGLLGEQQSYVIYYNMTLEEEEDDESEFILEGIMIKDTVEYQLIGEREVEDDEEKVEFKAMLDEYNYVESEYKVESEEIELEMIVVENGNVISETKIEIDTEDNETKIELEFLTGANTGTYQFKYETEDGQPILKVEFDVTTDGVQEQGQMTLSIHVDEVTGETYYTVFVDTDDDDYEERIDRDIEDDDDDEDEDEEDDDDDDSDDTDD